MDYRMWGNEYLAEAERLKAHKDAARKATEEAPEEERAACCARFWMLREMYLESLHTGRELLERGKAE